MRMVAAGLIALLAVFCLTAYVAVEWVLAPAGWPGSAPAMVGGQLLLGGPWIAVGLGLALRRGRHLAVPLVVGIGLVLLLAPATADLYRSAPRPGIDRALVAWANGALWGLALFLLSTLLAVFPSASLQEARLPRPTVAILVVSAASAATLMVAGYPLAQRALPLLDPLPVGNLAVIAAIADFARRFRATRGVVRAQQKWFAWSLCLVALGVVVALLTAVGTGLAAWSVVLWTSALPPIAIAIAILRYRLFDIDRVVSRTVSWTIVSAITACVVAIAVIVLQSLLAGITQGQTLAVAASTLLAAALFQPLRRRIQRTVDVRFDRARYDAERTAEAFAGRLRDQHDLPTLRGEITGVITSTVRPIATTIWLRNVQGNPGGEVS